MGAFEFYSVHSLVKIMPGIKPAAFNSDTALSNERYSFQLALYTGEPLRGLSLAARPAQGVTIRRAGFVPVTFPTYSDADEAYVSKKPEVYPDPLFPAESNLNAAPGVWHSFYVTVEASAFKPGKREIAVDLFKGAEPIATAAFTLDVLPLALPEDGFLYTNWVHYDCIAEKHRVKLFTPSFYKVFGNYLSNAVAHGMNLLLTPLFTPPLDTERGGERRTAQLIGVEVLPDGNYSFSFNRLNKFIRFAKARGVKKFELSHLFTQWGAEACPKIMARKEGADFKLFGWETPSAGKEYSAFLSAFLPALAAFLEKRGYNKDVYFHISDEPSPAHIDNYRAGKALAEKRLKGYRFFDALSEPAFLEKKYVDIPAVSASHIHKFYERGHSGLWTYTCCSDYKNNIPNRFIAMPPVRNRALGTLLYINGCPGYLHWGYNFYNSFLSRRPVDPFSVNDADGAFPAGDSFIVYPYGDGVIDSSRHEALYDGLQDRRLLILAAKYLGGGFLRALWEKHGFNKGFSDYPLDITAFTALRAEIHGLLRREG